MKAHNGREVYVLKRILPYLIGGVCVGLFGSPHAFPQEGMHTVRVSLGGLLGDLGEKHDRYFTIEDVAIQGEVPLRSYHAERRCPFSRRCDTTAPASKTLEAELDQIHRDNPNFRYRVDQNNSKIVHVIDDRLRNRSNYPMDSVVASVQFDGTLWDLVKYLSGRGIALNYMSGSLGLDSVVDVQTKVTISTPRATVRSVLSDFIKLDGRGPRILWESQTSLESDAHVDVWYPGAIR